MLVSSCSIIIEFTYWEIPTQKHLDMLDDGLRAAATN
jgi:hypothetical protein